MNVKGGDMAIVIGCPIESNNNKIVQIGKVIPPMTEMPFFKGRPYINDDWCWEVDEYMDVRDSSTKEIVGKMKIMSDKYLIPLPKKGFELDTEGKQVKYEEFVC